MRTKLSDVIARGQKFTEALARIATLPEADLMEFSSAEFNTSLIQIFVGPNKPEGNRDNARMVARIFGGTWTVRMDGTWQTKYAAYPGLEGVQVCIHYVEPHRNPDADLIIVDLSE